MRIQELDNWAAGICRSILGAVLFFAAIWFLLHYPLGMMGLVVLTVIGFIGWWLSRALIRTARSFFQTKVPLPIAALVYLAVLTPVIYAIISVEIH